MMQMVWTVVYRTDSKSPQMELDRYTKEAAEHFATGIIDAGGVAVVVEDVKEATETEEAVTHPVRNLQW